MKKQCLKNFLGNDICDTVYDFCNYYDYSSYKSSAYDKALDTIADKIEVETVSKKYSGNIIVICNITQFIEKYQSKINKILKEIYTKEFVEDLKQVQTFKPSKSDKFYTDESELFYYYYFDAFFNDLVNGSFSESNYNFIYQTFTGKED